MFDGHLCHLPGFPWLVVPALTLTGVAGVAVLLTNLQIANLFGSTRHLVIAFYCGASLSSSVIAYLMQVTLDTTRTSSQSTT